VMTESRNNLKFSSDLGLEMYQLIEQLYPICRSITGNGVRQTLKIIQQLLPFLNIQEVSSGTPVFDWTVPREWNIRDAYVKNAQGERIIDFQKSNLHVLSYSLPVKAKITLGALKYHIFKIHDHPDWIPYRTSYYNERWGFCLSHNQLQELADEEYEVCIDSSLSNGSLTYGEYFLQGESQDEVLFSCHVCHPSLCNDNLSGIALVTFLAKHLSVLSRKYSYRFLFIPGTIGSITWLSENQTQIFKIKHGLVLAGLGAPGKYTYKKSRQGDTEIDRAMIHVLKHFGQDHEILEFFPYGYDERQYCSPAFNLPIGCLMRPMHGRYAEYHTSGDNLDFVHPQYLAESFSTCFATLQILENNKTFVNQNPHCEPQLGRRGLYNTIGDKELAMLWVLNLSDGHHSLLSIAERSGLPFAQVQSAAEILSKHGLLKEL